MSVSSGRDAPSSKSSTEQILEGLRRIRRVEEAGQERDQIAERRHLDGRDRPIVRPVHRRAGARRRSCARCTRDRGCGCRRSRPAASGADARACRSARAGTRSAAWSCTSARSGTARRDRRGRRRSRRGPGRRRHRSRSPARGSARGRSGRSEPLWSTPRRRCRASSRSPRCRSRAARGPAGRRRSSRHPVRAGPRAARGARRWCRSSTPGTHPLPGTNPDRRARSGTAR